MFTVVELWRRSDIKRQTFLLLLALLLGANANAQLTRLTDHSLSNLTAASMDDAVPVIVVAGSSAQSENNNEVGLDDSSQSSVHAANLVNVSAGDVADGLNVFSQRFAVLDIADWQRMAIAQENDLTQTGGGPGTLGLFTNLGPVSRHEFQEAGTNIYSSNLSRSVENTDFQFSSISTTTRFDATVSAQAPSLFESLNVDSQIIDLPSFTLGLKSFDFVVDAPGELFDVEIKITPPSLKVDGAFITTGGLKFVDDQIFLTAPTLTLPKLTFNACFLLTGCNDDQLLKVTVPSRTLSLGAGLSIDNPINAHGIEFGYAIAGDGSLLFEDGNINFGGDIPFDLGSIAGLVVGLNVADHTFNTNLGALLFPDFSIPIDIDIPLVVPGSSFADSACVFSDGTRTCTPIDRTKTEIEYSNDGQTVTESSERIYSETHSSSDIYVHKGEVTLEDASANFIVLRNSSAEAEQYSVVVVSDQAQADVRAVNMINAAKGIVGSGLNVIATQSGAQNSASKAGHMLSQTNTITQIGGR